MPAVPQLSKALRITAWILQIAIAGVFVLTGFSKLSGAPEAIHIFETLGMEPLGRYATGLAEVVAAVLLLVPKTSAIGALLSLLVITGAIGSHVTKLGIQVTMPDGTSDGGTMFGMAVAVFLASIVVLFIRRAQLPLIGRGATTEAPHAA
ncbi:MAG: DoxX family protein [Phycisphaerales bacterium JB054]